MSDWIQDIRFAFRMLSKSPLITSAALLSLALGIGANTTIFSFFNAVLLRPLSVEDPDGLVAVYTTEEGRQSLGNHLPVSPHNYRDIRDNLGEVFSDVSSVIFTGGGLAAGDGEAQPAGVQIVSSNYFTTLGVTAEVGRYFTDSGRDLEAGAEPVAVLRHRLWSERFGGDPGVVGQTIRLNRQSLTVVGVAPRDFNGTFVLGGPDVWAPASMAPVLLTGFLAENYESRRALITFSFARLREGVSMEQAEESLSALASGLRAEYPVDNKDRGFTLMPISVAAIGPDQQGDFERMGGLLLIVVGLVLLIACGNVANLLLGRAAARRREIGVRLALGASRSRLARQLMCESLVLAAAAGALGLAFAAWARRALWSIRPPFLAESPLDVSFDPRVLAFTVAVTLGTGLLFGLAPVLRWTRPDIVQELTQSSDSAVGLGRLLSFRNLLLVGQIALSTVALVGSGLFLRGLGAALETDLGFEPEVIASIDLNLGQAGYDEARGALFFDQVLEEARRVPGVQSASLTTIMPLTGAGIWRTVIVEGRGDEDENHRILVPVNTSEPGLLQTLGLQLLRGRDLSPLDREEAVPVALVNRAMANKFWPGEDPVGERFHFIGQDIVREVVGIVGDSKHQSIGEDPQPQVYVPRRQNYVPFKTLVLRVAGDPETTLGAVRQQVQTLDEALPLNNVRTADGVVRMGLWRARMGAALLGVLGSVALLLAAVGIYGVRSYTVGQRGREISIRMALGADRAAVIALVLRQSLLVVAWGLGLGLAAAVTAAQALDSLLYGVPATDLPTLLATAAILLTVALLANVLPVRRATGLNPSLGLRFER
ncbi:MAG: ABC transporter permease [Acidobacteriota bacterium]